jgi:hypothetical protein
MLMSSDLYLSGPHEPEADGASLARSYRGQVAQRVAEMVRSERRDRQIQPPNSSLPVAGAVPSVAACWEGSASTANTFRPMR